VQVLGEPSSSRVLSPLQSKLLLRVVLVTLCGEPVGDTREVLVVEVYSKGGDDLQAVLLELGCVLRVVLGCYMIKVSAYVQQLHHAVPTHTKSAPAHQQHQSPLLSTDWGGQY
jgi:hypothetical protein